MLIVRVGFNYRTLKKYTSPKAAFKDAYDFVKKYPSKSVILLLFKNEDDFYTKGKIIKDFDGKFRRMRVEDRADMNLYVGYNWVDDANKITIRPLTGNPPNILRSDGSLGPKVKEATVFLPTNRIVRGEPYMERIGEVMYTTKAHPKTYIGRGVAYENLGHKTFLGNEIVKDKWYGSSGWSLSDKLKSWNKR